MPPHIVLVPGIGFGGAELLVLAWRLRRSGWRTTIFWTNPYRGKLAAKADDLRRMLARRNIHAPQFVAFSFGGRIVLQYLNDFPFHRPVRVVMLGSPLTGCGGAEQVLRLPGGRFVLGEMVSSAACHPPLPIPAGCEVGSIAGNCNMALGLFFCPGQANDTIIAVKETKHLGLTDHCVMFVSHTSIVFSNRVAQRVVQFLRTGRLTADTA